MCDGIPTNNRIKYIKQFQSFSFGKRLYGPTLQFNKNGNCAFLPNVKKVISHYSKNTKILNNIII